VDTAAQTEFFAQEKISKILRKLAPPVMFALLIQALYNIVDSFFVGQFSVAGLTALSVIFPIQFVAISVAVGTGVGVNTYMARKYGQENPQAADKAAGTGMVLELISWFIFAVLCYVFMRPYVLTSASEAEAVEAAIVYGNIVCLGSMGVFLEGNWTKVQQAQGKMRVPMLAQVAGALINIALDPLLIFGWGVVPALGIAGAAYATVIGQLVAALITYFDGYRRPPMQLAELWFYTKRIYYYGYSSILMQASCTVYIVFLNMVLAGFSDAAVTVLGLYYKLQTFFFIPLLGLCTCIVPVLSFNYARKAYDRCRETVRESCYVSAGFMLVGFICFVFFPEQVINIFSDDAEVHKIGLVAFPIIGTSFFSAVFSLMMPVSFQALGFGRTSTLLALTRQIFLLMPSFWLFSLIGLNYTWLAFPVSETLAGGVGFYLYRRVIRCWKQA
jgi:putative MATE family efflux protein